MILTALVKRYEQQLNEGKVVARGWSMADISFGLRIYENGEIADIIDLRIEEGDKKKYLKSAKIIVPEQLKRSSGIFAYFLCDNAKYFLGIDGSTEHFQAAKKLHLEILKDCDSAAARTIKNFFTSWNPTETETHSKLQEYLKELQSGARLIFMFEGNFATEDDEIKMAWENYSQNQDELPSMQCLITGKISPVAKIHPVIKGVKNSNISGGSIVSFNAQAFESYGHNKEQGLNAPISKYAAFAYTAVLNDLLSDSNHKEFFGDMTVVYWAEENNDKCQDFFDELLSPDEKKISDETLNAIIEGIKEKNIDFNGTNLDYENPFYILGLSPNNARLSVRLFLQNTFGEVIKNIAKHYEDLRIIKPQKATEYPNLLKLSVHHLRKLETARKIYFEKQLTDLMSKLSLSTKNSSTLTLEEQGIFILGYYHQTQERYKKREDKENG